MTGTAVLLDIEGTTTSISFVFDVLFPYAVANIPPFLASHAADPDVVQARTAILRDATPDEARLPPDQAVLAVVKRQMAADVKANGLKQLQGLVWRHGYESGAIQGHVYADVPACLAGWRRQDRPVAIYSSGSRLAQQLIFGHSTAGDLTPSIARYYDTAVGPKREPSSYLAIASDWGIPAAGITFCTDQPAEAVAAAAAGMGAVIIMRPGNAPLPANLPFPVHADLARI